jgi:hypothetical protein
MALRLRLSASASFERRAVTNNLPCRLLIFLVRKAPVISPSLTSFTKGLLSFQHFQGTLFIIPVIFTFRKENQKYNVAVPREIEVKSRLFR